MLEAVVVIFSVAIMIAMLLPALAVQKMKRARINCTNNLKQTGLAFRIWSSDCTDKYPMAVSVTNGGAMEAVLGGNPMRVFQVMSNELSTPAILICPKDEGRQRATNFDSLLTAKNVSYFVSADAVESNPSDIMGGDDNFEINSIRVKSGLLNVLTNTPLGWSAARHKFSGNLMLADGSVQIAINSELKNWFWPTNDLDLPTKPVPTRLAIP